MKKTTRLGLNLTLDAVIGVLVGFSLTDAIQDGSVGWIIGWWALAGFWLTFSISDIRAYVYALREQELWHEAIRLDIETAKLDGVSLDKPSDLRHEGGSFEDCLACKAYKKTYEQGPSFKGYKKTYGQGPAYKDTQKVETVDLPEE